MFWLPLVLLLPARAGAVFDLSWEDEGGALQHSYDGRRISPWHDVPFTLGDDDRGAALLSFVCEIPRGTRDKFEIHKSVALNPLLQDVHEDGTPRSYKYSPSIVNYGAIAQTWEDPAHPDEDTGLGGDNDPIDALQLNEGACERGAVQRVRVLGGLALVDGDETDWKLLVVDADAPDDAAAAWRDVADVPRARVDRLREWFRMYKTAEGKPENRYGLGERAVGADHALATARKTHELWADAVRGATRCEFQGRPCWMGERDKEHEL